MYSVNIYINNIRLNKEKGVYIDRIFDKSSLLDKYYYPLLLYKLINGKINQIFACFEAIFPNI